ncbi:MAG: NAD(P)-binding domain-containing protein, partial [Chloroflexota bacterium]
MTPFTHAKVSFIGGGHITEILLEKLLKNTLTPAQITISSRGLERLNLLRNHFGVRIMQDNIKSVQQADFIFIAVRPNVIPTVIDELKSASLAPHQIIISLSLFVGESMTWVGGGMDYLGR